MDLLTDHGVASVTLPLDPAAHQALPAVLALHAHGRTCPGQTDVHVGLRVRTLDVLGAGPPQLVVRADANPAVVLRIGGTAGTDVALGTLDACSLLCSGRLPVTVEPAG
ncbi:MAG: hypothetical protein WD080_08840 [Egibacteraceae bacterium]